MISESPQTIWQQESGTSRLRALTVPQALHNSDKPSDLALYTEVYDDTSAPPEAGWYTEDQLVFSPMQAMAAKVAIDSYLLQSGVIKGAAIEEILDRCAEPPAIKAPSEVAIAWGQERDRLRRASRADHPRDPLEAAWDKPHGLRDGSRDLLIELAELGTIDAPIWKLTDDYGEEILLTKKILRWLILILPAIERSHFEAKAEAILMEGMA